ncbi:MAG: hypothetical protein LUQ37_05840 [Methanoregulaceae archaeon]|nr:hypothetical protein [Methanoregulaceae archaeon]
MADLEQTGIEALFEVAEFTRGLDKYLKGLSEAEKATKKASDEVGRHGDTYTAAAPKMNIFSKALHGIGGAFSNVMQIASGFVVGNIIQGALTTVTQAIPDMISKASDLSETINKVNVVFGDAAPAIQQFAEGAATGIGQSTQAALDAASTFGIFGKAAGLSGDDLSNFSTGFTTLASDLASFNNTSPEEATLALGAALRGEAEPLRRYGVLLNDATMRQKALELGIVSSTKDALTPAQKILAAQALIYEQTSDAQGDFARTSGGLANQQRIMAAQVENLKAQLGSALLPVVQQITNAMTAFLASPAVQKGMALLQQGLTKIADVIGRVFSIMTQGGDPFANLQEAITAVFGSEAAAKIMAFIQPIQENLPAAIQALTNLWNTALLPTLQTFWDFISANILPILQQLWTWFWENLPGAINTLASFWSGTLLPALTTFFDWVSANIIPLLQTIFEWIGTNLPPAIQTLADFWTNTLQPALQAIWDFLSVDMLPVWEALAELLQVTVGLAIQALAGFWEQTLQPALQAMWAFIQDTIIPIFEKWVESLGGVEGIIKSIVDWIKKLTDKLKNIKLPSWMNPGSPTPWELGLVGVGKALSDLTEEELPKFWAELETTIRWKNFTGGEMVNQPGLARRSISTTNNQTANVNFGGVTVNGGLGMAELEGLVRRVLKSEFATV